MLLSHEQATVLNLVRHGAAIPHAAVGPSTDRIDWTMLELVTYAAKAPGLVCLPSEGVLSGRRPRQKASWTAK